MNDKVTGYRHAGDVLLDGRSIWHPARRADGAAAQGRHAVPAAQPVPDVDHGQRGRRGQGAQDGRARPGCGRSREQRLTEVGLWDAVTDRLKDSPFRLSGGQQQLLCLARALAISPDVLLLDEPTSSLDPMATESIEALIRTLVPGLTVVIVTHNLAAGEPRRRPRPSSSTAAAWSSTDQPGSYSRTRQKRRPRTTSAAASASRRPPAREDGTPPARGQGPRVSADRIARSRVRVAKRTLSVHE